MFIKFILTAVLAVCFTANTYAENSLAKLKKQIDDDSIYIDPTWLGLLSYKNRELNKGSEILSDSFFLSVDGRSNPRAELLATLTAITTAGDDDHSDDEHALCRFPARVMWLKQQFGTQLSLPDVACNEFNTWSNSQKIESVSLLFAAGFMSNPASFYGHMLLTFNQHTEEDTGSSLQDTSVNFGAVVPDNENMLVYIGKGLFGGYRASFSNKEYYNFQNIYGEQDLRDVWHYKLQLSPFEAKLLQAHSWELMGKRYKYYFIRENCAYRLVNLLEVVTGRKILKRNTAYIVPSEVFKDLVDDHPDLLQEITLEPSRQRSFYNKYSQLSVEQKDFLKQIVNRSDFRSTLDPISRAKVYETFYDYFEYLAARDAETAQKDNKRLALLNRIPIKDKITWDAPTSSAPHEGNNASMLRLAHGYRNGDQAYSTLAFRPAYYDALSLPSSTVEFAKLTMLESAIVVDEQDLQVDYIDLVSLSSLNMSVSGLPKDGGFSWSMRLGLDSLYQGGDLYNYGLIEGGIGKSMMFKSLIFTTRLEGALTDSRQRSGNLRLGPEVSVMGKLKSDLRFRYVYQYDSYFQTNAIQPSRHVFELAYDLKRNWDLRLNLEKHDTETFSMGISKYW